MESTKIWTTKYGFCNHFWISKNNINYSIWNTSFFKYIHYYFSRINLTITRLPNYYITKHSHTCWKITCYSSEVKWCNGIYKPLKWSVFYSIPIIRCTFWLIVIYVGNKLNIESQKINKFTRSINFCLMYGFRLCDHCSSINFRPVGASN